MNTNRRAFMTALTSGVVGLGLSGKAPATAGEVPPAPPEPSSPRVRKYNPLGDTGLKVSDVSFGAISLFQPNVLRYAFDCGVNYFDTAEAYIRTRSESMLGEAFKGMRDKVVITTKYGFDSPGSIEKAAIVKRVEASLQRLQSDYIDVAMLHAVEDPKLLENEVLLSTFAELRQAGKIRFLGFSTHSAKAMLPKVADPFKVVLVIYSHMEGKEIEPLLAQTRQTGVGVVAMKLFAGGMQGSLKAMVSDTLSYPQAAIRWVLSNPSVDCCIVTMSSYAHVEEYLAASGQPLQRADLRPLQRYREAADRVYCRVSCRECLAACPRRVAVNDVLRFAMYFEHYRMEREAVRYYRDLADGRKPFSCGGCPGPCESACPHGLSVRQRLLRAHDLLTV